MEALGPVLALLSLPLMFRWIPPNRFFGLRIPSVSSSEISSPQELTAASRPRRILEKALAKVGSIESAAIVP